MFDRDYDCITDRGTFKNQLVAWVLVGLLFVLLNSILLFVFIECIRLAPFVSTVLAGAILTFFRYFVLDKHVFHEKKKSVKRFAIYHLVTAIAFLLWILTTNFFISYGINYQISALLGMVVSTIVNFITNFFIVWNET